MNPQIQRVQIPRPTGGLSACYDALIYQRGLPAADQDNQLGFLCFETFDALERAAQHVSLRAQGSKVATQNKWGVV